MRERENCVRVEEDVLGSLPTLIVRIVSTDVKQHLMKKNTHTHTRVEVNVPHRDIKSVYELLFFSLSLFCCCCC